MSILLHYSLVGELDGFSAAYFLLQFACFAPLQHEHPVFNAYSTEKVYQC